jgi:hypothetical protein
LFNVEYRENLWKHKKGAVVASPAVGWKSIHRFYRDTFYIKGLETLIEIGKKHMKEEGENLKKILEK